MSTHSITFPLPTCSFRVEAPLAGLGNKIKDFESLCRKAEGDALEKVKEATASGQVLPTIKEGWVKLFQHIFDSIGDSLRFTIILQHRNFELAAGQCLAFLVLRGFKFSKIVNYFVPSESLRRPRRPWFALNQPSLLFIVSEGIYVGLHVVGWFGGIKVNNY